MVLGFGPGTVDIVNRWLSCMKSFSKKIGRVWSIVRHPIRMSNQLHEYGLKIEQLCQERSDLIQRLAVIEDESMKELSGQLKLSEQREAEIRQNCETTQNILREVINRTSERNKKLESDLTASTSAMALSTETCLALRQQNELIQHQCDDLKQELGELKALKHTERIAELERQLKATESDLNQYKRQSRSLSDWIRTAHRLDSVPLANTIKDILQKANA